jgi:pimeloyl-ACP methyl ester carboxylesterase
MIESNHVVVNRISWAWDSHLVEVGLETRGTGPMVLMLPALSSISTRAEMRPLAKLLAADFMTIAVDWPGFGNLPRPAIAWNAGAYRAFLTHILEILPRPACTIAAGHSAGYLIGHAAEHPGSAGRLALIAPTRRGPLPTMMGGCRTALRYVSHLIDVPVIGFGIYRLNVNRSMIRLMGRGHVYSDPAWLDESRLSEKLAVTNAPGARHASFRFVTGELDPMLTREDFLTTARRVSGPILVAYGAATPPRSKLEMEALSHLPNVQSHELPSGKLAVHEEFPTILAEVIRAFVHHQ